MSTSAIERELMGYFTQLNEQQKKSLLELIKTFLNPSNSEMNALTIEDYNNELEEAESEFERGEYITHEEMLKQIKEWQKTNTK